MSLALNSPEVQISEIEAQALAEGTTGVARWYMPINPVVGPAGAWVSLLGVLSIVYGPKIINAVRKRRGVSRETGLEPPPASPIIQPEPMSA